MLNKYIQKTLERTLISLCVILCMQLPFFITQYTHQLRGHVDELKWQVERMEMLASFSGKSLDHYIAKFVNHSDLDVAGQGTVMRTVVHRFEKLSHAWTQLKNSSTWTRPFVFLRYVQSDIFSATFHEFKMGISFAWESIVFGLIGMFIGSGLCSLIESLVQLISKAGKRRLQDMIGRDR